MKLLNITILLFCSFFLSSCGNYLENKESKQPIDLSKQEKIVLDFKYVKDSVFGARCVSCHQQYNSYQGVLKELPAIRSAVAAGRMPKTGGPLSDSQKHVLANWIAAGAPEMDGSTSQPIPDAILEPTWKSISENITIPKCLVCHNPQGQAKFLDLSSRQIIFLNRNRVFGNGAKLINFEKASDSYLVQIIKDEEEPMPPTWSNISTLSEAEMNIIAKWIELGLP